jgi:hypothetical protein
MRENHIQTGNSAYSADSVSKLGEKHLPPETRLKVLSTDQMQLLINSDKLKHDILNDKVFMQEQ